MSQICVFYLQLTSILGTIYQAQGSQTLDISKSPTIPNVSHRHPQPFPNQSYRIPTMFYKKKSQTIQLFYSKYSKYFAGHFPWPQHFCGFLTILNKFQTYFRFGMV